MIVEKLQDLCQSFDVVLKKEPTTVSFAKVNHIILAKNYRTVISTSQYVSILAVKTSIYRVNTYSSSSSDRKSPQPQLKWFRDHSKSGQ